MRKFFGFTAVSFFVFSSAAWTNEEPPLLAIGAGGFNLSSQHNKQAMLQVEYKFGVDYLKMRPVLGALGTSKRSFYFYGGFAFDIFIAKNLLLVPGFAPGIYVRGNGKDLGFPLEFRSSVELSYRLPNCGRVGAVAYHMSNASISHRNPGSNSIAVFYAIPL